MYQVVYTSEPVVAFSDDDLRQLLAVARAKNRIDRLTGMLVFCDNQFLQVIEGNAEDVIRTFDRIGKDSRHENLMTLHRGYAHAGTTFRASAMGFHSVSLNGRLPSGGFSRENGRINFAHFDDVMALDFLVACREQALTD